MPDRSARPRTHARPTPDWPARPPPSAGRARWDRSRGRRPPRAAPVTAPISMVPLLQRCASSPPARPARASISSRSLLRTEPGKLITPTQSSRRSSHATSAPTTSRRSRPARRSRRCRAGSERPRRRLDPRWPSSHSLRSPRPSDRDVPASASAPNHGRSSELTLDRDGVAGVTRNHPSRREISGYVRRRACLCETVTRRPPSRPTESAVSLACRSR
jgi:hypothetical protein